MALGQKYAMNVVSVDLPWCSNGDKEMGMRKKESYQHFEDCEVTGFRTVLEV